ncbi:MAG: Ureidoglycolate hydrolase [Spirulinaceae cyanobacterium SM2_1_0]|nr:Ureidoglycolate hydrolase [Spirulinaceae cyanobacterium SM2_1_0]
MTTAIATRTLPAQPITVENFRPYGQLIQPTGDGKPFDADDAQLNLSQGTPRFYIMRLTPRDRRFRSITRHSQCTQCLGALGGREWFLAVAPPSDRPQPQLDRLQAFRIPGDCFVKLETGTWHAGPHFDGPALDFYNLELSDTNEVDHFSYNFVTGDRCEFVIT